MTEATRNLIKKFAATRDTSLVPQIFIGINEEDDLGNKLKYKSCLKLLRNISAHEPATFISQVHAGNNTNNFKLVFITLRGDKVVLDLAHFTAWMFDAYRVSDNIAYLVFWKAFMLMMFPAWEARNEYTFMFKANVNPLINYMLWMDEAVKYGSVKLINPDDDYINNLYGDNSKLFWRYAIPDMSCFVRLFVNGTFDIREKVNTLTYLEFFEIREGNVVYEQKER